MFYLTTRVTHFIYNNMESDTWLRTTRITRKKLAASLYVLIFAMSSKHWRRKRGGGGGGRGTMVCLCPPPPHTHTFNPHFHFPLELYVYITLRNNYMAFFIYQLIILWTISIKWHRWLLVNNHISKYNSFILVLYRRYINYVSVCPPPPPHTHTLFGTFLRHWQSIFIWPFLWHSIY